MKKTMHQYNINNSTVKPSYVNVTISLKVPDKIEIPGTFRSAVNVKINGFFGNVENFYLGDEIKVVTSEEGGIYLLEYYPVSVSEFIKDGHICLVKNSVTFDELDMFKMINGERLYNAISWVYESKD